MSRANPAASHRDSASERDDDGSVDGGSVRRLGGRRRARRPHGGDELRAEEVVDECHDPTFAPAHDLVGIAAAGRTIRRA